MNRRRLLAVVTASLVAVATLSDAATAIDSTVTRPAFAEPVAQGSVCLNGTAVGNLMTENSATANTLGNYAVGPSNLLGPVTNQVRGAKAWSNFAW